MSAHVKLDPCRVMSDLSASACQCHVQLGATLNLLTNAVEASGQGAWVRVTVRPAVDGLVHLDVKNEAESTSDENVALVLEPFFTTKPVGSGLGLAIVKQLMTTLRGTVDFQQQGGVVTVSLGIPATSAEHDRLAGAAARG